MVVREDADIGSVVVGDIHKKSKCAQLRLLDAIEILSELRKTQLDVLHCGLGLQDVTDDIADDVGVTRALFGEYPDSVQVCGKDAAKGFVAEVQDAMKLEGPECVEPPRGMTRMPLTVALQYHRRTSHLLPSSQFHAHRLFPLTVFFAQCTRSPRAHQQV